MAKLESRHQYVTFDAARGGVEKAKKFLSKSVNRDIRLKQVCILARLMLNGRWQTQASGEMMVTKSGLLKQGQHRLTAFIKAAEIDPTLKVVFCIKFDVPDDEAYACQANVLNFNKGDVLAHSDRDKEHGSVLKFFLNRGETTHYVSTHEDVLDADVRHADKIDSISKRLFGTKVAVAQVKAAILRAWVAHGRDADILRFCDILGGVAVPHGSKAWELSPYKLRSALMDQQTSGKKHQNKEFCQRGYCLTENALKFFLDKAAVQEIRITRRDIGRELFPLPGEPVPSEGGKTLFLVPVPPRGRKTVRELTDSIFDGMALPWHENVRFRKIPPRSEVALMSLPDRKVFAHGIVKKMGMTDGNPHVVFSSLEKVNGGLTPESLMSLSISARGMPNPRKMTTEVTALKTPDLEVLTRK